VVEKVEEFRPELDLRTLEWRLFCAAPGHFHSLLHAAN
jgi:hypothetical protein